MSYIDGFVLPVPTANRDAYKTHAEQAALVFKEHGALKVIECWGDDASGQFGVSPPNVGIVTLF